MSSKTQESIERRVVQAAESALADHHYVSAIDVLVGMGYLKKEKVVDWRHGRVSCLERVVEAGLGTISRSMGVFRSLAARKGLKPGWTAYHQWGRGRKRILQFSKSGNPAIEKAYCTHFIQPHPGKKNITEAGNRLPPEDHAGPAGEAPHG